MQGDSFRKQLIVYVFDNCLELDEICWHISELPHFSETNLITDAEIMCCITEKLHIISTREKKKRLFVFCLKASSRIMFYEKEVRKFGGCEW